MDVYTPDGNIRVRIVPHELLDTRKDRYTRGQQLDGLRELPQDHLHLDVHARCGFHRVLKLPSCLQRAYEAVYAHDLQLRHCLRDLSQVHLGVAAGCASVGYHRVLKLPPEPLYAAEACLAHDLQLRQHLRGVPYFDVDLVTAQTCACDDRVLELPPYLLYAAEAGDSLDV